MKAVPDDHKKFLAEMVWIHEEVKFISSPSLSFRTCQISIFTNVMMWVANEGRWRTEYIAQHEFHTLLFDFISRENWWSLAGFRMCNVLSKNTTQKRRLINEAMRMVLYYYPVINFICWKGMVRFEFIIIWSFIPCEIQIWNVWSSKL